MTLLGLALAFAPIEAEAPPTADATAEASPTEAPPTEAPPAEAPAAEAPAAPLDDEVPVPHGISLQRREYRQIAEITGLDLESAWASYEDKVADGLEDPFAVYLGRRFRIRRNIGIGVTCWGIAAFGVSVFFAIEASQSELYDGQGFLAFSAAATSTVSLAALITGGILWSRWGARVRVLRDTGVLARRPTIAPIALQRGGGLGVALSF